MLRITTTPGLIGINQTPPRLAIKTNVPELPLQTQAAQLEVNWQRPQVTIDQSHIRAELGFRDHRSFGRHYAQEGQQAVIQGIGRLAHEGDRMAAIEHDSNAIPRIAQENYTERAEVNIALWPTRPPAIQVLEGKLTVDSQPGGVKADYQMARVEGSFSWAVVDVYLRQQPAIEVEAVVDTRV